MRYDLGKYAIWQFLTIICFSYRKCRDGRSKTPYAVEVLEGILLVEYIYVDEWMEIL